MCTITEKALVGALSVIVKTNCETDGLFYSTSKTSNGIPPLVVVVVLGCPQLSVTADGWIPSLAPAHRSSVFLPPAGTRHQAWPVTTSHNINTPSPTLLLVKKI